jgi:hypothetical protein
VTVRRHGRARHGAAWAVAAAVLLTAAGVVHAAGDADWEALSPSERTALSPLKARWGELDDGSRARWLDVAGRFPSLSAEERQRVQGRMAEWSRLTPSERGQARLQYQAARRWTPEERQERWQAYQSLDPQARRVLAERWKLAPGATEPPTAGDAIDRKRNWVEPGPPTELAPIPASPISARARSGATTQPLTRAAEPPPVQQQPQPGVPKIAATDAFVDPATLLPRRGPQGAAARPAPSSDPKADTNRRRPGAH